MTEDKANSLLHVSRAISLALAVVLLAACSGGSAKISQVDRFAIAGAKYADAVPKVLDQAFEEAVKADTLALSETRDALSRQDRLTAVEKSNQNLGTRLALLNSLREHANVLRTYFIALKALAETDAKSGLTEASKGLIGSMEKISKPIAALKVGELPIKDFANQAVPIVVAQFQAAALNDEFKARAAAIERELDLQQAALTAIAASMKSSIEVQYAASLRDRVVLPYVNSGALPSDWEERRLDAFRKQVDLAMVDAAANAAKNLRISFIALAENRLDEGGVTLVLQDIDKTVTLLEAIAGKKGAPK